MLGGCKNLIILVVMLDLRITSKNHVKIDSVEFEIHDLRFKKKYINYVNIVLASVKIELILAVKLSRVEFLEAPPPSTTWLT